MRRASQKHAAQRPTTSVTQLGGRARTVLANRKYRETAASTAEPPVSEVLLTPAGTFANGSVIDSDSSSERHRQLAIAIRQRIESRLPGRVRNLVVKIHDQTVLLEGQCATYYSKQLAQHCALGILEDEQLENAINVCVPRK